MGEIEDAYVREIAQVLDKREEAYLAVTKKVMEAVREDCGYPDLDPDTYDDVHRSREQELWGPVGLAVHEYLVEVDVKESSGIAQALLKELVGGLTQELGEKYVPEPDDYREWYEGDEPDDE